MGGRPEGLAKDKNGFGIQVVEWADVKEVNYLVTSVQSDATMDSTIIRLVATTDCYVEIGTNPTATASGSTLLPALVPEYIKVSTKDKVAAIRKSADGTLNITEIK